MVGLWWLLVLVSSELRWQMASIGDEYSAWLKLGWGDLPLAYQRCALAETDSLKSMPLSLHWKPTVLKAALPVAGYMVLWVLFGNVISSGEALPLLHSPPSTRLKSLLRRPCWRFFWARQLPTQVSVFKIHALGHRYARV